MPLTFVRIAFVTAIMGLRRTWSILGSTNALYRSVGVISPRRDLRSASGRQRSSSSSKASDPGTQPAGLQIAFQNQWPRAGDRLQPREACPSTRGLAAVRRTKRLDCSPQTFRWDCVSRPRHAAAGKDQGYRNDWVLQSDASNDLLLPAALQQ